MLSDHAEYMTALERARNHAQAAGESAQEAEIMGWLAANYFFGPTHVDLAQARLDEILVEARAKSLLSYEAVTVRFLGGIEGLRGRFDEARERFRQGHAILAEIGASTWIAGQTQVTGYIELLAGDPAAAEREFRFGYDEYERMGATGVRSTNAAVLAAALYEQGRDDESGQYVQVCRDTAAAEDYISQVLWRAVEARLLARRGQLDESEQLAREAVGLLPEGQAGVWHPEAWSCLGETLALAGKRDEAVAALSKALQLHEQKGNIAGTATTRNLCTRLGLELR
jgi:tetratricopeptide (TPR) repeat protein